MALAIGALVIVLAAFTLAYACGPDGEDSCPGHGQPATQTSVLQTSIPPSGIPTGPTALKDVVVEVTNIPNGVVVKMTSTKAGGAEALQARFADYAKSVSKDTRVMLAGYTSAGERTALQVNGELRCNHAPGSEACEKAHESGDCKGHEPGVGHNAGQ
jgi:hypothetical protein